MKLRTVCAVSCLGNTHRWLPLWTSWNPGERQRERETNRKNERQREKMPAQGRSQPQPQTHPQIWRSVAERETEREDTSPGEKSATATDASLDLEKHGREGDRERRRQPRGEVSHSHRCILGSGEAWPRGRWGAGGRWYRRWQQQTRKGMRPHPRRVRTHPRRI